MPDDRTLSEMLVSGEIDALYSPRTPQPFRDGDPRVARLFADLPAVEADYYARTGIFPVMHVVAIRRELYQRHRWIARSLFDAFEQSRQEAVVALDETASLRCMLPWLETEVRRTRSVLGQDFWRYGLADDDPTIATFLAYSYEQGLARRRWTPAELFAPEATEPITV